MKIVCLKKLLSAYVFITTCIPFVSQLFCLLFLLSLRPCVALPPLLIRAPTHACNDKVVRFGEGMLEEQRKNWPPLEAMRGLAPSPSTAPPGENGEETKSFAWPGGLDRVEFWREGRVVVRLLGGTVLDKDSLEWLVNNE